jgi:hypothetical protein
LILKYIIRRLKNGVASPRESGASVHQYSFALSLSIFMHGPFSLAFVVQREIKKIKSG